MRAKDLNRQALDSEAQEGMSATFVFFEHINSSNLSHACPSWGIFGCPLFDQAILVFSEFPCQRVEAKKYARKKETQCEIG